MNNEEEILTGNFPDALLDKCKYEAQINDIIKLSVSNVYQSKEVINKEIAGYEVITKLLETFIKAANNNFYNKASTYDKLILKTLPKNINIDSPSLYNRLLSICHFVASLSDSNAILTFKKLKGIQFSF